MATTGGRPEKRGRGRPVGTRVDPVQRQATLLDAAERAIRAKGPAVGLSDIAAEAGFVRSAVYAMYPHREALLTELSMRTARRLLGEISTRAEGSTDLREAHVLVLRRHLRLDRGCGGPVVVAVLAGLRNALASGPPGRSELNPRSTGGLPAAVERSKCLVRTNLFRKRTPRPSRMKALTMPSAS